jgi:hypothetical protein
LQNSFHLFLPFKEVLSQHGPFLRFHLEHNIAHISRIVFQPCYTPNTVTLQSDFRPNIYLSRLEHLSQGLHLPAVHVMVSFCRWRFSQSCFIEHLLHYVHMSIILLAVFIQSTSIKCCSFVEYSFDDVHLSSTHLVSIYRAFTSQRPCNIQVPAGHGT